MADDTPTIFCTRTNSLIDTCLTSPEAAQQKLARYCAEYGPDLIVIPFDEAYRRHEDAAKTEPEEITEQAWHDALCVLPPVAWMNTSAGESFKMLERLTGRITGIYVRIHERHFQFYDDIRTPHDDCCHRVAQSKAYRARAEPGPAKV